MEQGQKNMRENTMFKSPARYLTLTNFKLVTTYERGLHGNVPQKKKKIRYISDG